MRGRFTPPPPWWGAFEYDGEGRRSSPTLDDVIAAEEFLKYMREKEKEKTEKEKRKKPEPAKFTFLETLGLLMLFSLPLAGGQIWLLSYIKNAIH